MRKIKFLFGILLITSLVACGGETNNTNENTTNSEKTIEAEKANTENTTSSKERKEIEITVTAKGNTMTNISFDPATLTIEEGTHVTITLRNASEAAGMNHNFVLVPQGAGEEIARAALTASATDYVPEDERIIVASKMTEMGEEVTFDFIAPAKGSYHYICTYPGHYPAMVGRLNVK